MKAHLVDTNPPLVLTATVSRDERRRLEAFLKRAGFEVRGVEEAGDVDGEIARHPGSTVLIIDSGLLAMSHDPQWRRLRQRQPGLGAIVRTLIAADPGIERADEGTFLAHPDQREGLVTAIRALEG
jgi:hypothetical protein